MVELLVKSSVDPRIKIFIALCLSTSGVLFTRVDKLLIILIIGVIYGLCFNVQYFSIYKRIRRYLQLFIVIIIIQSIFNHDGQAVLTINGFALLTDEGIIRGISYLFRIYIIVLSGAILTTSNMRDILQAFIQLKLPYDIAFMVAIGIKFMPLLVEEIQNIFTSIQLRGIDINMLSIKKRIEIVSYLFMPVIMNTLVRAKKLAISVDARGFRAYNKRTSLRQLRIKHIDEVIFFVTIVVFSGCIYF